MSEKEYGSYSEMVEDLRKNDPEKLKELQNAFNDALIRWGLSPIPFEG